LLNPAAARDANCRAPKAEIHRPRFRGLQHLPVLKGPPESDADGDRAERAADHRGDPARQRMLDETALSK